MPTPPSDRSASDRQLSKVFVYRNVMEFLVNEEIDKQFRQLSSKRLQALKRDDVAAFALNRLPSLYATTERGWRQQSLRGRRDMGAQIASIVQQAVTVVQREPVRMETPLHVDETADIEQALVDLQNLLRNENLTWKSLPDLLERTLVETTQGNITWQARPIWTDDREHPSKNFYKP